MEYLKCVAQQAKPVVSQAVAPAARDGERDPERERERERGVSVAVDWLRRVFETSATLSTCTERAVRDDRL